MDEPDDPSVAEALATPPPRATPEPDDTPSDAELGNMRESAGASYVQSPVSVKRKRMEELAELRRAKKAAKH